MIASLSSNALDDRAAMEGQGGVHAAAAGLRAHRAGEVLVQFSSGADASARSAALAAVGGKLEEIVRGDASNPGESLLARVSLGEGVSVERALEILSNRPGVTFAEPNYVYSIQATSNDPAYVGGQLWGMYGDQTSPTNQYGSQAGEVWATGHIGSTSVTVGVVDTGIDYTHPDLYLNIWLNQGEIPKAFRSGLVDVDGDGLIGFRDLNHDSNAAFVSDVNGNGRIDAGDLLSDSRWETGSMKTATASSTT